tara:strand:+ start:64 stop:1314 length:1251 start_codon:yes stop_codon:yes gene_type:complete
MVFLKILGYTILAIVLLVLVLFGVTYINQQKLINIEKELKAKGASPKTKPPIVENEEVEDTLEPDQENDEISLHLLSCYTRIYGENQLQSLQLPQYLKDKKRRVIQLLDKLENEGNQSLSSDEKKLLDNIGIMHEPEVEELSSEDFSLELQLHKVCDELSGYETTDENVTRRRRKRIKDLQKGLDKNEPSLIILEGGYPDNDVVIFESNLGKLDDIKWFDEDRPIDLRGKSGSFLDFLLVDEICGARLEKFTKWIDDEERYEEVSGDVTGKEVIDILKKKGIKNIIDFYGLANDNKILNRYIYKILLDSTQSDNKVIGILDGLKLFIPNEKFVIYKRWGENEDEYIDEAYVTDSNSHKEFEWIYPDLNCVKITPLPNHDNFKEGAKTSVIADRFRIFKYSDFQKIIKNHKKGMLKL